MAPNPELREMTLFEHLGELRRRLIISVLVIIAGTAICFSYASVIFDFLTASYYQHFPHSSLIGTGPAEAFLLKIKVAVFSGILLMSPVLFFQLWLFLEPGLYPKEKKLALPFVLCATSLFLIGVWFCHQWVLPFAFEFFYKEYQSIHVTPTVRISEHLATLMQALIGFGVVFEMPVLAFFLGRFGIINHRTLIDGGRYAIVIIFIISAILTPPDALTQFLMAGPLLLLYGLSILIVKFTAPNRNPDKQLQVVGTSVQPPS